MFIIGLSGGIGCGKSAVTKYLRENHGIKVIDCDEISKNIYPKNSSTYKKLLAHPEFKNHQKTITNESDHELNRRKLGELIFKNETQRAALNSIVQPAIRWEILTRIFKLFLKGEKYVVIDAPTLFESKSLVSRCRYTVCVFADESQQLERVLKRDVDLTEAQALNRIKSQIPIEEKRKLADIEVDNSRAVNSWNGFVDELVKTWDEKEPRFGAEWKEALAYVLITLVTCAIIYYCF